MTRLPGLRRVPPPAGVPAPRLGAAGRIRLVGTVLLVAGGLIHTGSGSAPPAYRDLAVSVTGCSVSRAPAVAEVVYTVANHGGQALIVLASGDAIGLAGVSFSSFSASWVEFG